MPASEARIRANRANALKSSGPKTPEGKNRSRLNARKHGLTGDGVALTTEDKEAVEGRFDGMMRELSPSTIAGGVLVKRAAMLSVRLDRSYEQEAANISARVLSAETDLKDRRMAEVEHHLKEMKFEPVTCHRRLMATPEGVDKMIERWGQLKADLDNPEGCHWVTQHQYWADWLMGRLGGTHTDITPFYAWTMAIGGDFEALKPEHFDGMTTFKEKCVHAMNKVADLVDVEVAKLQAYRASMDTRAVEAERSFAAKRALFDPTHQAILARRYEAAAARDYHKCLAELRQVEAEAEARIPLAEAEAEASPDPDPTPEVVVETKVEEISAVDEVGMGSFGPASSEVADVREVEEPKAVDRSPHPQYVGWFASNGW